MSKIILCGATGNIGQRILAEALQRGHEVTAFVRDPAKLTGAVKPTGIAQGDVTNPRRSLVPSRAMKWLSVRSGRVRKIRGKS